MLVDYFDELAAGLEEKIRQAKDGEVARRRFTLEIARLGRRLFSGEDKVAWCGVLVPFDLLSAMGVTSCFVEFVGAILASSGNVPALLEEAEHAGYSTDGCSYHRAVIGATLRGLMPKPDFLVATSAPCGGGVGLLESLARYFGKEMFLLSLPQSDGETGSAYLASQIEKMVEFVSAQTGKRLEPERLRRAIECTNEARALMVEAYELARAVPSPVRSRDLKNFGVVMALFLGTEAAIEIARTYRDEFASRCEKARDTPPPARVRLLWIQNRIQFKSPLVSLLEKEYDADVVSEELNTITWEPLDPDDPYTSLARRMLSIPFIGPIEHRIQELKKLAKSYRVDGAMNPCHWGCRQGTGARGLVEAGLKEIGVPVLNLEVDCVDPRNFSEGQLRTRIEAFLEMIGQSPLNGAKRCPGGTTGPYRPLASLKPPPP